MVELFPSLISANLLRLQEEIELLEPHVAGFHIDIMDFHFVPNLTWGPAFVEAIRQATHKKLWIHLMVDYPEKYLSLLELFEHDIVSIHWESPRKESIEHTFDSIRARGLTPSLAINPRTSLEILYSFAPEHVLLMSVEPGFSGQEFIENTFDKLKELALYKKKHNLPLTIALDGGINLTNTKKLVQTGAEQLAIASGIFSHQNRVEAVQKILKSIE